MEEPRINQLQLPDKSPGLLSPAQMIDLQRAENERLKILVDFIHRPVCAYGGDDPDPDIVAAYNLAVEATLQGIRRAALGGLSHSWGES